MIIRYFMYIYIYIFIYIFHICIGNQRVYEEKTDKRSLTRRVCLVIFIYLYIKSNELLNPLLST